MENRKIQRINSDIYRVLSIAIREKLGNTDIYGIDILNVQTSADLSEAKIFVSVSVSEESEQQKIFNALISSGVYLRAEIAKTLNLKNTPKLKFILDKGRENAARVEELLQQIKNKK